MEYPPSKDDKYLATNERGEIIQPLTHEVSERIPPDLQALYDQAMQDGTWKDMGNAPGGEGLVHFDIDPQNRNFHTRHLLHATRAKLLLIASSIRWLPHRRGTRRPSLRLSRSESGRFW